MFKVPKVYSFQWVARKKEESNKARMAWNKAKKEATVAWKKARKVMGKASRWSKGKETAICEKAEAKEPWKQVAWNKAKEMPSLKLTWLLRRG